MKTLDFTKHIRVEVLTLDGDTILDTSTIYKNRCYLTTFLKGALSSDGACHVFLYQSSELIEYFIVNY